MELIWHPAKSRPLNRYFKFLKSLYDTSSKYIKSIIVYLIAHFGLFSVNAQVRFSSSQKKSNKQAFRKWAVKLENNPY